MRASLARLLRSKISKVIDEPKKRESKPSIAVSAFRASAMPLARFCHLRCLLATFRILQRVEENQKGRTEIEVS